MTRQSTFIVPSLMAIAIMLSVAPAAGQITTWSGEGQTTDWYDSGNWLRYLLPENAYIIYVDSAEEVTAYDTVSIDRQYLNISGSYVDMMQMFINETEIDIIDSIPIFYSLWISNFYYRGMLADIEDGVVNATSDFYCYSAMVGASEPGHGYLNLGPGDYDCYISQLTAGLGYYSPGSVSVAAETIADVDELLIGVCGSGDISIENSTESAGEVYASNVILATGPQSDGTLNIDGLLYVYDDVIAGLCGSATINIGPYGQLIADNLLAASANMDNHGSCTINITGHQPTDGMELSHSSINLSGDAVLGDFGTAQMQIGEYANLTANNLYLGLNSYDEYQTLRIDDRWVRQAVPVVSSGEINMSGLYSELYLQNLYVGGQGSGHISAGSDSQIHVADSVYIPGFAGGAGSVSTAFSTGSGLSANNMYLGCEKPADGDEPIQQCQFAGKAHIDNLLKIGPWGSTNIFQAFFDGAALENESTTPENVNLFMAVFFYTGNTMEVASAADGIGIKDDPRDFEISLLSVNTGSDLRLLNQFDNTPDTPGNDVLYVDYLIISPGATLNLNGLTVVYDRMDNDGIIELAGGQLLAARENAGDINSDGTTDLDDFIILKQNYGAGTTLAEGDLNLDGTVNLDDFIILKQNYGTSGS